MRVSDRYNNLGIEALALAFVLQNAERLSISKLMLVLPITAHKEMLSNLANGAVRVQSFERYVIEKVRYFSNFNDRYYGNLVGGVNALQFLYQVDLIEVHDGVVSMKTTIQYDKSMGLRAKKIYKAAGNISKLLSERVELLYLNARVKL